MLVILIIAFGILSRILIHTPNFTPVLALAIFGGLYLKGRQAIWVPLVLMVISDLIIGFHDSMFFTWGGIFLVSAIGLWLKGHKTWSHVLVGSIFASFVFFVVSNFGSFLSLSHTYAQTWAGLQQCYIAAIPFYRSTLISTVAYTMVLYVLWEFLLSRRTNPFLTRLL